MGRSARLALSIVTPWILVACSSAPGTGGGGDGTRIDGGGSTPDGGGDGAGGSGGADGSATPGTDTGMTGGTGGSSAARIEPAAAAQDSAQRASDIIKQLGAAIAFETGNGAALTKLFGGLLGGGTSDLVPKLAVPPPLPRPLADLLLHTPARKSFAGKAFTTISMTTQEENFDDTATDLGALLKDRLLAEANVEAKTDTSVTYLLKGDPTCRPLPSAIAAGRVDQVDLECASDLAKLQIRVVVSRDGDGYRFAVRLGPDRLELSTFIVHTDLLGWEMDLNMARKAADFANMALGKASDPFPFASLQGRVKVAVQKLADKRARVTFSVLETFDLEGKSSDPFKVTIAASDPLLAVTGDGTTKEVTLKLTQPRTDLRLPWDPSDTGAKNTDLHIQLGGLFGETRLSGANDDVVLTGVGIAPSFAEVRSSHIVDVAFNPANGNKVDVKVTSLPGDRARIELTPRFDLSVGMAFDAIASELKSAPPAFLLHETYSALLADGTPVVVETVNGNDTGFAGGIKMVAGSLKLSTSSDAAATVSVPTGQCLTSVTMPPQGSHALLGKLTAVACP
jgi:hypothetical protein